MCEMGSKNINNYNKTTSTGICQMDGKNINNSNNNNNNNSGAS